MQELILSIVLLLEFPQLMYYNLNLVPGSKWKQEQLRSSCETLGALTPLLLTLKGMRFRTSSILN